MFERKTHSENTSLSLCQPPPNTLNASRGWIGATAADVAIQSTLINTVIEQQIRVALLLALTSTMYIYPDDTERCFYCLKLLLLLRTFTVCGTVSSLKIWLCLFLVQHHNVGAPWLKLNKWCGPHAINSFHSNCVYVEPAYEYVQLLHPSPLFACTGP